MEETIATNSTVDDDKQDIDELIQESHYEKEELENPYKDDPPNKMSQDQIIQTIKEVKEQNEVKKTHYLLSTGDDETGLSLSGFDSESGSSLTMDKSHQEEMAKSRKTILGLEATLRKVAILMVIYSLIFLTLKIIDFSDINIRMNNFHIAYAREESVLPGNNHTSIIKGLVTGKAGMNQEQLNKRSKDYQNIYYEVNIMSLLVSIVSVIASIYIWVSLRKTGLFSLALYKKFFVACMFVLVIFCFLMIHMVMAVIGYAQLDIRKWVEGILLISQMTSDNFAMNIMEFLSSLFLIMGIYVMVFLSDQLEVEIRRFEKMRDAKQSSRKINMELGGL